MGVYVHDQANVPLSIVLYLWLLSGFLSFIAFWLAHWERKFQSAKFHNGDGHRKDFCSDCRTEHLNKNSFGEICFAIIGIPLMLGFMTAAGLFCAIPLGGDGDYKEALALIRRKKLDYYGALSLPVLALLVLWWM